MSARAAIVDSLVKILQGVNGSSPYKTNIQNSIDKRLLFWDEVNDFPYVCIIAGTETREYHPAGFKWGFLNIRFNVYVNDEYPVDMLNDVLHDVEIALDANQTFQYPPAPLTKVGEVIQLTIDSIVTDEGLLAPYGVGEISCTVRYEVLH